MYVRSAPFIVLPEPELAFGPVRGTGGGETHDPQKGLSSHGPYSLRLGAPWHPAQVRLLPIAPTDHWKEFNKALTRLLEFERMPKKTAGLRTDFPGFAGAFHAKLEIAEIDGACQRIAANTIQRALDADDAAAGYRAVLNAYADAITSLGTLGPNDVVPVMLPDEVVSRYRRLDPSFSPAPTPQRRKRLRARQSANTEVQTVVTPEELNGVPSKKSEDSETLYHDLRRSLKVIGMRHQAAIQIVTGNFMKEDEQAPWAYKFWNISTSLFCKAGGIPWRLVNDEDVAFCGIRFGISKSSRGGAERQSILVGLAQVVNASGQLVALKAGQATRSLRRSEAGYFLTQDQARELIRGALRDFEEVAGRLPRRVVVHKSSPFKEEEVAGMEEAAMGIRELDLVYVKDGASLRLLPERGQPADRGTLVPSSDASAVLYTSGYVPDFEKYRGMHVPSPLEIVRARSSRSLRSLARDVLALTKMNWNSTLFETRLPTTFDNATEMIGMMKELGPDESLAPHIRYYI